MDDMSLREIGMGLGCDGMRIGDMNGLSNERLAS